MQGLTWWRGAPEAVTRGAASVVDEWGVVVGAAALEGEKRRKPWLRCCPWRTGDSQQTSGTNISLRSLPSFFSILRLTGFMYVGVRFISEAPFLKGARSSRAISFEITSLFLFFPSPQQTQRSRLDFLPVEINSLLRANLSGPFGLDQRRRRRTRRNTADSLTPALNVYSALQLKPCVYGGVFCCCCCCCVWVFFVLFLFVLLIFRNKPPLKKIKI